MGARGGEVMPGGGVGGAGGDVLCSRSFSPHLLLTSDLDVPPTHTRSPPTPVRDPGALPFLFLPKVSSYVGGRNPETACLLWPQFPFLQDGRP